MTTLFAYIIMTQTATLAFGGVITYLAWSAYRRTGSDALRTLALGLGLVAVGSLLAGLAHQLLSVSFSMGIAVQSTFTALGFLVLTYSLYLEMHVQASEDIGPSSLQN